MELFVLLRRWPREGNGCVESDIRSLFAHIACIAVQLRGECNYHLIRMLPAARGLAIQVRGDLRNFGIFSWLHVALDCVVMRFFRIATAQSIRDQLDQQAFVFGRHIARKQESKRCLHRAFIVGVVHSDRARVRLHRS